MKIELYSFPKCEEARMIREFLEKNNFPFREIDATEINAKRELHKLTFGRNISTIKITRNHSINAMIGFNELFLKQEVLEHIKKYNPKLT